MSPPITTHEPEGRVELRLHLLSPPMGLVHAVIDTNEIPVASQISHGDPLGFLFALRLERGGAGWRFADECVWTADDGRSFLVVAAGSHAGQLDKKVGGRAAVFLPPVTEGMIGVARTDTLRVEGTFVARSADGGPASGDVEAQWRNGDAWLLVRHRLAYDVLNDFMAHYREWLPIADATIYGHDGYRYDVIVVLNSREDVRDVQNSTTLDSMRKFVCSGLTARNMADLAEIQVDIHLFALDDEKKDYLDHFSP